MRLSNRIVPILFAMSLATVSAIRANTIYDVTIDNHLLDPNVPVAAAFALISGGGPVTNMAIVSGIGFGGGFAGVGCPAVVQPCSQGATGDLTSSIVLDDTPGYSQFVENLFPGNTLTFHLDLTTNAPNGPGSFPDQFIFALLSSDGIPLAGADPVTGSYFFVQLDSANPTVQVFSADTTVNQVATVPEPGSLTLLAIGAALSGVGLIGRKSGGSSRT